MKQNRIWRTLFVIYCGLMLVLLFHRAGYDQLRINLTPFHTIQLYLRLLSRPAFRQSAIINLAGNVVMFIPLGFLLPRIFDKQNRLWKVLLTTAVIITLVELVQYVTLLGSCDIDDLILNVIGAAIGYGIYKKCLS